MSLSTSLALAIDPVRLAERAGLTPDEWQRTLLRTDARQIAMLCCRQSGKSTTTAVLAVDEAVHRPPALVLLLAPALRQAQELFKKVKAVLAALGPDAPPVTQESALSLELATGSRVVCLPGKEATVRGFSAVSLLVVDEAAWVDDALYHAVRPFLAISGGRLVLLSTPFGKRGFFYEEFTNGGPAWARVKVTAYDCPRIDPAWLAEERAQIPPLVFRSEYMVEFVDTIDAVFASEHIDRAIRDDLPPLFARPV